LLQSRPKQYPLLLELREPAGMANPIEEARRAMDELTRRL
jgi:hypothetical protein